MMSKPRVGIYGARHALAILRRGIIGRCADITAVSDSRAELLRSLERGSKGTKERIFGAMRKAGIDRWGYKEQENGK